MSPSPIAPDGVAAMYSAAASTLNTGTGVARTPESTARPVATRALLTERLEALETTTSALLVALATVRDGAAELTDQLQAEQLQKAVHGAAAAGDALRTMQRLLADPDDLEEDE